VNHEDTLVLALQDGNSNVGGWRVRATNRIAECHHWMLAKGGTLIRCFRETNIYASTTMLHRYSDHRLRRADSRCKHEFDRSDRGEGNGGSWCEPGLIATTTD
jgi:hypothetical protein